MKNFAIFSPHFSPMSAKNFARISLSGFVAISFWEGRADFFNGRDDFSDSRTNLCCNFLTLFHPEQISAKRFPPVPKLPNLFRSEFFCGNLAAIKLPN